MRRFLYISPYFPPQSRVGALRPLKFARHLPSFGWAPVVLCDLWPGAKTDGSLTAAIPDSTTVVREYSWRARRAERASAKAWANRMDEDNLRARRADRENRLVSAIPSWLNNPELIPLGEHSHRMPYALAKAHEVLRRHGGEAIVVNADPYAACLVGARLKRETGLPLVLDLRDPWAPCELRRPRRPGPVRLVVDRLERRVIEAADKVILNTETTWRDYRAHYPEVDAEKFTWIRNHADADLICHGSHPGFDRFSLLFLGNFGRFIKADVVLASLAEVVRRGESAAALQLVVTGDFPQSAWQLAERLGVQQMLHLHPHVPYRETGAIMAAADLLLLLIQPQGRQRLAAKLFDYLVSERPVLAIAENEELGALLAQSGAGEMRAHADVNGIADVICARMKAGRQQRVPRRAAGFTSSEAAASLAHLLDTVTGEQT